MHRRIELSDKMQLIGLFAHFAAGVPLLAAAVKVVALPVRLPAARADDGAAGLPVQGAAARVPLPAHVAAQDVARVPRPIQRACSQVGLGNHRTA